MDNRFQAIPIGDIQLYDNDIPSLYGGNYEITVTQTLTNISQDKTSVTQKFAVYAPQFMLDPSEVLAVYPPAGSTGQFADTLPHMLLYEPALPWERKMPTPETPWLALLIFQEDELSDGLDSPTRSITTTVADFLHMSGQILTPTLTKEIDVADTQVCQFIKLSTTVFQAITPRLTELPFLAHVRQVNTSDKVTLRTNEQGTSAVIVGNRFPAVDLSKDKPTASKNIVHLVSLEGLTQYLVDEPVFTRSGKNDGTTIYDTIALLSLASWTFQCLPDPHENFQGLLLHLLYEEYNPGTGLHQPTNMWLRRPPPQLDTHDPKSANSAVVKRIQDGFVPLAYHTRTGEETFAWYRGPLVPLLTMPLQKANPFFTADAALIYDRSAGVFDLSLASAWNIGRALALADKSFGQELLHFRQRAHRLIDRLYDRLQRDHFATPEDIAQLAQQNLIQASFLQALNAQLLADIANINTTSRDSWVVLSVAEQADDPEPDPDPKTALECFLADPTIQQVILSLVKDDVDPIARWLARLALLYSVPFDYLVADPAMLPIESLRFFYLDINWLEALLDGALSIGMESSRQTVFAQMTRGLLQESALAVMKTLRNDLLAITPQSVSADETIMTGLLLRSALVSGWPNLAIHPYDKSGTLLNILRMDHLSTDVLLCIFLGIPDHIEISEPQEGLRFGVDEQGKIELRNLMPPQKEGDAPVGEPLNVTFQISDPSGKPTPYLRPHSRVLQLAPTSQDGLLQQLKAHLVAAGQKLDHLSPTGFAVQMIKAPQQLTFDSQTVSGERAW